MHLRSADNVTCIRISAPSRPILKYHVINLNVNEISFKIQRLAAKFSSWLRNIVPLVVHTLFTSMLKCLDTIGQKHMMSSLLFQLVNVSAYTRTCIDQITFFPISKISGLWKWLNFNQNHFIPTSSFPHGGVSVA